MNVADHALLESGSKVLIVRTQMLSNKKREIAGPTTY
jgi:hypothetical protein